MTNPDPDPPEATPIQPALAGEEHFRLVTGFADLFTAVVLVTGFFAVGGVAGSALGPFAGLAAAGAAWWLSYPFVHRRNFAASGIVLALGFAIGVQALLVPMLGVAGSIIGALASWIYWRFHKVPTAAAAAILTPIVVIAGLGDEMFPGLGLFAGFRSGGATALGWGVIVFAIAMYWDLSDRLRQTRRSDVAFWLHLAAAPLIVHGAFAAIGLRHLAMAGGALQPVLILFAVLALVALIVDRRPILVSSLSYLAYAMASTIDRGAILAGIMTVALILGGGVLVLAVGWQLIRGQLLRILPTALAERLPPPAATGAPVPEPEVPAEEKEPLRLIFGFNDIFVCIGLSALITGSMIFSVWQFVMPAMEGPRTPFAAASLLDWRVVLAPAAAIWLAAEYFARHRRMALPSIQLATSFAFVAAVLGIIIGQHVILSVAGGEGLQGVIKRWQGAGAAGALHADVLNAALAGSAAAAAANLLFWWRHKVPISFALALGCLLVPAFVDLWIGPMRPDAGMAGAAGGADILASWQARALLCGLALFAAAMLFDRSDKARRTLRSDTAFWLHLSASLLVLPALFSLANGLPAGTWLVAALFAALLLLALAIDRRAPVLVAMPFVIREFASSGLGTAAVTLMVCAVLIAMALYWERLRGALMRAAVPVG